MEVRKMQQFLLKPIDLSDPAWKASIVHGGLWVLAASEQSARQQAVLATVIALVDQRGAHPPAMGSPWNHPSLSTCEMKACPFALRPGVVVDEDGHPVDP